MSAFSFTVVSLILVLSILTGLKLNQHNKNLLTQIINTEKNTASQINQQQDQQIESTRVQTEQAITSMSNRFALIGERMTIALESSKLANVIVPSEGHTLLQR